ncbi:MAG TPA: VOC family protein [Anaerolineae bacterium]|nr:VOC family protein [Anaerolineae bacterium]
MISTRQIQHVSIPRPPGSDDTARAFYGQLLGLQEVPVPQSIQHLDLVWFRLGNTELHLFAEEPINDASGRHYCFVVDNLKEAWDRLVEAGYAPWDTIPIPGRPRFFCRDPFNNTIEFTMIEGNYLELEAQANGQNIA